MSRDSALYVDTRRAAAIIFGALLLASVFLPWFTVHSFGMDVSISGSGVSEAMMAIAAVGGLAAIGSSFIEDHSLSSFVCLVVGILVLVFICIKVSSFPSLSIKEGPFRGTNLDVLDVIKEAAGAGFYFYFLAGVGLVISGLAGIISAKK